MKHILYETTNLINGKKYVGLHSTDNLNDGYLGSGVALNHAINKYTIDCFHRVILHERNTREEIIQLEEKIVDDAFMTRSDTYNLRTGGRTGVIHSMETRRRMSEAQKGISKSEETKKKISEFHKGKPKSEEHKKKLRGPKSEEHKRNISESKKGKKQSIIECPHCGKHGGISLMKRYHFDNCPYKKS